MIPHIQISKSEYQRAAAVAGFPTRCISLTDQSESNLDREIKIDSVLIMAFRRGLAEMEKDPPVWKRAGRKAKRKEE